jgi:hypothetical protein
MRTPRLNDIIKAQKLKKEGMSYMDISRKVLGREDKKTIYRWMKVNVGKKIKELSTVAKKS